MGTKDHIYIFTVSLSNSLSLSHSLTHSLSLPLFRLAMMQALEFTVSWHMGCAALELFVKWLRRALLSSIALMLVMSILGCKAVLVQVACSLDMRLSRGCVTLCEWFFHSAMLE